MARPKGAKNIKKHVFQDPQIEEIVEEWIEYTCPKRGKVRELIKVKRLKKVKVEQKVFVGAKDILDDLESQEEIVSTDVDPEE